MKRIISACLEQTHIFETEHAFQVYIYGLDRKRVKYKIVAKEKQPDNSILVKVKRQYNHYKIGDYLN